jgi:ElaB/YqjD/DUF883 family membrane-anchored ribosome-binding protein
MSELTVDQKDQLMTDLQRVLVDAEALLSATAGDASSGMVELRQRVQDTLSSAKAGLIDTQSALLDRARAAAKVTDEYVHENPWKSISIAGGAALLIGLLLGRR